MGLGVHVLIYGTLGHIECSLLYGGLKFVLGGLHQRRVESTTNLQGQSALGTGFLQFLTGGIDGIYIARDNQLARTVVVGSNHYITIGRHFSADFLNLLIGQTDDGSHSTRVSLASLLHGIGAGSHQLQTILKAERTYCYKSRELTE